MIFAAFFRALGQLGDPRFRRVLWLGALLSLALLVGVYALFLLAVQTLVPETTDWPVIGEVTGLRALLSWGSAFLMILLSVFLMMPVASAFTGLFLDDVVDAVEARHHPHLPPATRQPLFDMLIDSANFFALLVAVDVLAIFLYAFAGPFTPVVFWAVNGFLLGREYFTLVAARRLGRPAAKAMRAAHAGTIWAAGTLMAVPLSLPIVNLVVPVLGAATFTHIFHRLAARAR